MPATNADQGMSRSWKLKSMLGSGSFGEVVLYQHEHNGEYIALKKCKVHLQAELVKRWADEVAFMKKLQHDHIVRGVPVPDELEAPSSTLQHLGMEYCSRGDLRKKLSEPAHVCGLPEAEILTLAKHISSAMEYLHTFKIIHRDIKPENIMIQNQADQNVYKLTDLGFAKDSKIQPATSFVGTKEYMAPELYSQTEYTVTVDYWSFGTVISETITGNRPFMLSGVPVVKWHKIIAEKTTKQIGYYEDAHGNKSYSDSLPQPNPLCQPIRESLEQWLGLMLRRDPSTRGGILKDGRPMFYEWLKLIINCKMVHVRSMIDGRRFSYPTKPKDMVEDLQRTLSNETRLPGDQHILIVGDGTRLSRATEYLQDCFRNQNGDSIIYMLQKGLLPNTNRFSIPACQPLVTALMENRHSSVSENGFKVMWKQALNHCHHLMNDGKDRVTGFIAFLNYNLRLNSSLRDSFNELKKCRHKLEAAAAYFGESLDTDRKQYSHQASRGVSSAHMYATWKESEKKVATFKEELEPGGEELDKEVAVLHRKVCDIQRDASRLKNLDRLNESIERSDEIFRNFKTDNKVKRREDIDCRPIQDQVRRCQQQYRELNKALFEQLRKIQLMCQEIEEMQEKVDTLTEKITKANEDILDMQKERQKCVWELLEVTMRQRMQLERSLQRQLSNAKSLRGATTPPTPSRTSPSGPLFGPTSGDGDGQPNVLTQESMNIVNQSFINKTQFDQSLDTLEEFQLQSLQQMKRLNWDHLN